MYSVPDSVEDNSRNKGREQPEGCGDNRRSFPRLTGARGSGRSPPLDWSNSSSLYHIPVCWLLHGPSATAAQRIKTTRPRLNTGAHGLTGLTGDANLHARSDAASDDKPRGSSARRRRRSDPALRMGPSRKTKAAAYMLQGRRSSAPELLHVPMCAIVRDIWHHRIQRPLLRGRLGDNQSTRAFEF